MNLLTLEQHLMNGRFDEVKTVLNEYAGHLKMLPAFKINQIYDNIFKYSRFDVLSLLIDLKILNLDLAEYENFDGSVFHALSRLKSVDKTQRNALIEFFKKIQNIKSIVAGKSLLFYLVERSAHLEIVQLLIDFNFNCNEVNSANENLLHTLIKNKHISNDHSAKIIEFLVKNSCDVNCQDLNGKTPLMLAIENGLLKTVGFLIEYGADPNVKDFKKQNSFYYALIKSKNYDYYRILKKGVTPELNVFTEQGTTVIFDYIKYMTSSNSNQIQVLSELILDGGDVNIICSDQNKKTSSLELSLEKPIEILMQIHNSVKFDINLVDGEGNSILHKLCSQKLNHNTKKSVELFKKVKFIVELGADIDIKNNLEQTPMMCALDDDLKIQIVEYLIRNKNN